MTKNVPQIQTKSTVPSDHEMMVFQTMAKQAVGSKMYRGIGDEFAVMTIMLAARELDIPPMAALNGGIHIINGRTEISARMMAALIMRRGHILRVLDSTTEACTVEGVRYDNGEKQKETFTMDEAKIAGLIKDGSNWKKWPKDMLYNRAVSRLARRLFPDIIGMGYIEGEIRESVQASLPLPKQEENAICHVEIGSATGAQAPVLSEDKILETFLSRFDTDRSKDWSLYIDELRKKLSLSVGQIVESYNRTPEKAEENFQKWLTKQTRLNEQLPKMD